MRSRLHPPRRRLARPRQGHVERERNRQGQAQEGHLPRRERHRCCHRSTSRGAHSRGALHVPVACPPPGNILSAWSRSASGPCPDGAGCASSGASVRLRLPRCFRRRQTSVSPYPSGRCPRIRCMRAFTPTWNRMLHGCKHACLRRPHHVRRLRHSSLRRCTLRCRLVSLQRCMPCAPPPWRRT